MSDPRPPSGFSQQVEEHFRRPSTTPKLMRGTNADLGGHGLGPDDVWMDLFSRIRSDQETAEMLQGTTACYMSRSATNFHSFAETKFGLEQTDGGYNFEVRARVKNIDDPANLKLYYVKLAYLHQGAGTNPQIIIGKADLSQGLINQPLARVNLSGSHPAADPTPSYGTSPPATDCMCWPPFDDPGNGKRVWLRIEVDAEPGGGSLIKGVVAWDDAENPCPTGQDITQCPYVCEISFTDSSAFGFEMAQETGHWALSAHEGTYSVDELRAGSETQVP